MTPSELKRQIEEHGHEPYFFSRDTMRFFGDTMANYGVRKYNADILELYRKRPVKHGLKDSAYFCAKTFKRVKL